MSMKPLRVRRNATYNQIRADLRALGYDPLRPMFIDQWQRYRLLVVAINHLATVLGKEPYRVYQALLFRAMRTITGSPFTPDRQAQPTEDGRLKGIVELATLCPHCGRNLLDLGKITPGEVNRERTARRRLHVEEQDGKLDRGGAKGKKVEEKAE